MQFSVIVEKNGLQNIVMGQTSS